MPLLVKKLKSAIKRDGVILATRRAFGWAIRRIGLRTSDRIGLRMLEISKELDKFFNSTVAYGPFRGLRFTSESWWCGSDRSPILLGLYEQEVLESLASIPKSYNTFIDLGAADGYYGIGVLINNLFEKSYCFEISDVGQEVIRKNARLNNVSDRVKVFGIANEGFYNLIAAEDLVRSVLFVDIEGGEFDLLDKSTFDAFKKAIIFIELHDWLVENGPEKLKRLKDDCLATHVVSELTTTSRDLSKFAELKKYNDTDRWLICSERRAQMMTWLRLDPIEPNSP